MREEKEKETMHRNMKVSSEMAKMMSLLVCTLMGNKSPVQELTLLTLLIY